MGFSQGKLSNTDFRGKRIILGIGPDTVGGEAGEVKVCCGGGVNPKELTAVNLGSQGYLRQLGGAAQGEWPVCKCSQASGGGLGPVVSPELLQLGGRAGCGVQRAGNSYVQGRLGLPFTTSSFRDFK